MIDVHEQAAQAIDSPSPEPIQSQSSGAVRSSPKEIALTGEGRIAPTTHTQQWRIAVEFLKSGAMPSSFENAAQAFMALQFLSEHKIPYVTGIRQLMIVNGVVSCWGDLPLALVRRSGKLEFIDERIFDVNFKEICFENRNLTDEAFYAVCRLKRDDMFQIERVFSLADAKKAGLLNRERKTPWDTYPRRMLQMRARSWAIKDAFPDVLCGTAIAEYDFDAMPEALPAKNQCSIADELNAAYLPKGEQ
jgi:hypothetical protein